MPKFIDKTGKRYGRLTVTRIDHKTPQRIYWECKCDCGKTTIVAAGHLASGHTISCGCAKVIAVIERCTKHGLKPKNKPTSGLYASWQALRVRIGLITNSYKGRASYERNGISCDPNWLDFSLFYDDMGSTWFQGAQLHRKNRFDSYRKDNCVWLSKKDHAQIHASERRKNNLGKFTTY